MLSFLPSFDKSSPFTGRDVPGDTEEEDLSSDLQNLIQRMDNELDLSRDNDFSELSTQEPYSGFAFDAPENSLGRVVQLDLEDLDGLDEKSDVTDPPPEREPYIIQEGQSKIDPMTSLDEQALAELDQLSLDDGLSEDAAAPISPDSLFSVCSLQDGSGSKH
jgi:hypothetical protein